MADWEVITQLAKRNYSIDLLVPASKGKIVFSNTPISVRTISLQMRTIPFITAFARSIHLAFLLPIHIIRTNPNFIITEPDVSILSFIPTIIVSKLKKTKLILDIRTVPVETYGFLGLLMKLWFAVSISMAKKSFDGLTIITPSMKKEICDRFHINSQKIGVWSSGVSIDLFNPKNSTGSQLRNNLGLSSKFIVFYHGIFGPTRGLQQCIEATDIVKKTHPDITLFLLGEGPITPKLKQLISEKKLETNVIIHDPVDQKEVPNFISMCNIAIVPLPNNQFWRHQSPLKLLEYLAMEKAVILTEIPAHTQVTGTAECALYIPSIEPSKIAAAIESAYINRANLDSWGKIGRKIAKKYTWDQITSELEKFLSSFKN